MSDHFCSIVIHIQDVDIWWKQHMSFRFDLYTRQLSHRLN